MLKEDYLLYPHIVLPMAILVAIRIVRLIKNNSIGEIAINKPKWDVPT